MLNHFTIQGRFVADPETRTTQSGVSACSFRVAWSEKYKEAESKLFIPCVAWRGVGEMISRNFFKGKEIIVEGKLTTREWTDKEGNKRQTVEMTVERAHFCGPKGDSASSSAPVPAPAEQFSDLEDHEEELPF